MVTKPCGAKAPIPSPPRWGTTEGTSESKKGAGGTLLPASFRTRSHGRAPSASRTDPERSMLVVWQWGTAVKVPPIRQVPEVGGGD